MKRLLLLILALSPLALNAFFGLSFGGGRRGGGAYVSVGTPGYDGYRGYPYDYHRYGYRRPYYYNRGPWWRW
jgi:hypothetical protein